MKRDGLGRPYRPASWQNPSALVSLFARMAS